MCHQLGASVSITWHFSHFLKCSFLFAELEGLELQWTASWVNWFQSHSVTALLLRQDTLTSSTDVKGENICENLSHGVTPQTEYYFGLNHPEIL